MILVALFFFVLSPCFPLAFGLVLVGGWLPSFLFLFGWCLRQSHWLVRLVLPSAVQLVAVAVCSSCCLSFPFFGVHLVLRLGFCQSPFLVRCSAGLAPFGAGFLLVTCHFLVPFAGFCHWACRTGFSCSCLIVGCRVFLGLRLFGLMRAYLSFCPVFQACLLLGWQRGPVPFGWTGFVWASAVGAPWCPVTRFRLWCSLAGFCLRHSFCCVGVPVWTALLVHFWTSLGLQPGSSVLSLVRRFSTCWMLASGVFTSSSVAVDYCFQCPSPASACRPMPMSCCPMPMWVLGVRVC